MLNASETNDRKTKNKLHDQLATPDVEAMQNDLRITVLCMVKHTCNPALIG